MQLGMIGLGRMGANMVRRLLRGGHACVVHDRSPGAVRALEPEGAAGAASLDALAERLAPPRAVWLMLPVAAVDGVLAELVPRLAPGDIVIDGGNSHPRDALPRARRLRAHGLDYVDCGTSGGVHGLERGYCLMLGGEAGVVKRLEPILAALAPGRGELPRTPGRTAGTAEQGYLHCGPHGAGHFVKMVHNGIEYGLMAAYAEGLGLLAQANRAEAAPPGDPDAGPWAFELAEIAELWRRGSVISSWLLDLAAEALARDPELASFSERVPDSGEGRWALGAAVDAGVPAPVLAAALFARFASRDRDDFQNRVLSALRFGFGGHVAKT
jgi:6-phosphogluconate dehydrogenase